MFKRFMIDVGVCGCARTHDFVILRNLYLRRIFLHLQEAAGGRLSVCMTTDVPFKEMASHCEALVIGRQQKMSIFMCLQQKQETCPSGLSQDHNDGKHSSNLCTSKLQMVCVS